MNNEPGNNYEGKVCTIIETQKGGIERFYCLKMGVVAQNE